MEILTDSFGCFDRMAPLKMLTLFVVLLFSSWNALGFSPDSGRVPSACHLASTALLSSMTGGEDGVFSAERRDLLRKACGLGLSSMILGTTIPTVADDGEAKKTILITGANSGIGFEACKRLAQQGHRLVVACRTKYKAMETIRKLDGYGGSLIPGECDLASLGSIKAFAESLPVKEIDCLCLNAGLSRNTAAKDVLRTAEGFELTVGVNHFGHFYLNSLLLPIIEPSAGRIVITASGVHDPESPGGKVGVTATLGDLQGLEQEGPMCEMIDGGTFDADKAYKDSKVRPFFVCGPFILRWWLSHLVLSQIIYPQLCNVLFTRELQRRLERNVRTQKITANCFNPGLIVGTGLFRDQNPVFTKLFDLAATDLLKVGETPEWGGGALAYMTMLDESNRGLYYSSDPGKDENLLCVVL